MRPLHRVRALLCLALLIALATSAPAKRGRVLHTEAEMAQFRENLAQYGWVQEQVQSAVGAAEEWVTMSDQELWGYFPEKHGTDHDGSMTARRRRSILRLITAFLHSATSSRDSRSRCGSCPVSSPTSTLGILQSPRFRRGWSLPDGQGARPALVAGNT